MTDYIQVMTTIDKQELAEAIARHLVDRRLAACVQTVGPITSTYRWQGKVETSGEWLSLAKCHRAMFPQVEAAIREVHTYDVPEIVAMPIVAGNEDYLSWLGEQIS